MRRCPYCGEKIASDADQCKHCGKSFGKKKKEEAAEKIGLTNVHSWENKSVPTWLMVVVVGGLLFCVYLMISQGCQK